MHACDSTNNFGMHLAARGCKQKWVRPTALHTPQDCNKRWNPLSRLRMVRAKILLAAGILPMLAVSCDSGKNSGTGVSYTHDQVSRAPRSIHILKIERSRRNLEVKTGAVLRISTEIVPALDGVTTAICGRYVLVRDGKKETQRVPDSQDYKYRSVKDRHPRSAIGANRDFFSSWKSTAASRVCRSA